MFMLRKQSMKTVAASNVCLDLRGVPACGCVCLLTFVCVLIVHLLIKCILFAGGRECKNVEMFLLAALC